MSHTLRLRQVDESVVRQELTSVEEAVRLRTGRLREAGTPFTVEKSPLSVTWRETRAWGSRVVTLTYEEDE